MLLRSSSTPVLGSLLSSFSESTSRDFDHHHKKMSFNGGHNNFSSSSCNSSPITKPRSVISSGFRRAQSDGNLEDLAQVSCDSTIRDGRRTHNNSVLQTIPSFSIYSSVDGYEEEEEGDYEDNESIGLVLERSVTVEAENENDEFSFGESYLTNLCLIKEDEEEVMKEGSEPVSPPLFLARGLGIDSSLSGGGGGGGCFNQVKFGDGGQEESGVEEHYKRMVEESPGNPLFLRNYAQFLYQSKGDLRGAEEFYSRAILLDPGDGEILSQYAKLVWELHHDHERASSYFERSVQVAPQDSHVLAAYASFLWETEDESKEDNLPQGPIGMPLFHGTAMTSSSA